MTIDEWLRLVDILKWPAAAIAAVFVFRKGIESLLARIQRAAVGGRAIDFAEPAAIAGEQQQKQISKVAAPETAGGEAPPPPAPPAVRPIEEEIVAALARSNASDDVKRAWLI